MDAYIAYVYILIVAIFNFLFYKQQRLMSVFLLLFMMLMCGLRGYDVGVDTYNYVDYAVSANVENYKFGPIYIVLKNIANLFDNRATAFLILMAVLTYIPLIYFVCCKSLVPALSVLMYIIPTGMFFFESFNLARQSIAIIYILWAAVMLESHKKIGCLLIMLFAFLLHPYTIIFILFLFLQRIDFSPKKVFVLIVSSVTIGMIGALSGIQQLLNLLALLTADNSSAMVSKFAKYADYDIGANFSIVGQLSHILPLSCLCLLGTNKIVLHNLYYKMMVWGCVITNIFVSVIYCERIASTYTISQFLAVPFMYKFISNRRRILLMMLLLFTAMLYIYNIAQYSLDVTRCVHYHIHR